jgi:Tfp pilus assembly protein PilF
MDRIAKLKEFIAGNPSDSFVQHALALEYVKLGDDQQAKKIFEGLLRQNENYIGSYYHLAKLLERMNQNDEALRWYEKGMQKAKEAGDLHAFNELMAAYDDLT